MLPQIVVSAVQVLAVLIPAFVANAFGTIPRGAGPPMDFGRTMRDGRRVLGPSKTWSGFLFGALASIPVGALEVWIILNYLPDPTLILPETASVAAALPVIALLTFGAMTGDALGSFIKRRMGAESGARVFLLDQLPFVVLPIVLGLLVFPSLFVPVFAHWEAVLWVLVYTLALHALFNWIGYKAGLKKVPW